MPSLPWTLDLFCLHSGLSLVHLLTHLSISQTRLTHDFDFQGGHSLSYRASPDAAAPTQTPSKRNPALLSLVPAGAWKACPLSHTLDPTPRPLTIGLPPRLESSNPLLTHPGSTHFLCFKFYNYFVDNFESHFPFTALTKYCLYPHVVRSILEAVLGLLRWH